MCGTVCSTSHSNGVSVSKTSLVRHLLFENSKSVAERHRDICPVDLSWGGSLGTVVRILLNGDFQHRVDKVRVCGSKTRPPDRYVSVYWRWTWLWYLTDESLLERITPWIRVQFEEFKCHWLEEEIPITYGPQRSCTMFSRAATAPYSEPDESELHIPVTF
jgi:hypothetical protein